MEIRLVDKKTRAIKVIDNVRYFAGYPNGDLHVHLDEKDSEGNWKFVTVKGSSYYIYTIWQDQEVLL